MHGMYIEFICFCLLQNDGVNKLLILFNLILGKQCVIQNNCCRYKLPSFVYISLYIHVRALVLYHITDGTAEQN